MTMVIATGNPHKVAEFARMLRPLGVRVLSQREAGAQVDVEETGETFEENAHLKALAVSRAAGLPALGDDSGLCVDALDGAPGIFSARYAGPDATDADRIAKLLGELRGVPAQRRTARFVCAICCVLPDGREITARGECEGSIALAPSGRDGFGYDPVFVEKATGRTFAQLSAAEKDRLSHRGRALRAFAQRFASYTDAGTVLPDREE